MVDLNFSDDDEEIIFVAELKSCEQKLINEKLSAAKLDDSSLGQIEILKSQLSKKK